MQWPHFKKCENRKTKVRAILKIHFCIDTALGTQIIIGALQVKIGFTWIDIAQMWASKTLSLLFFAGKFSKQTWFLAQYLKNSLHYLNYSLHNLNYSYELFIADFKVAFFTSLFTIYVTNLT